MPRSLGASRAFKKIMVNVFLYKESRYPVDRKRVRLTVEEFLVSQGVKSKSEVSISIVGDRKMRALNNKYSKRDETTDVLSFSLEEGASFAPPDGILRLGDVVISYPQAVKNASENNLLVDTEIDILVKHGLTHLLGIHHEEGDRV